MEVKFRNKALGSLMIQTLWAMGLLLAFRLYAIGLLS